MSVVILAFLALLPSTAVAFQADGLKVSGDPVWMPDFHVAAQDALRKGSAWQGFLQGEGYGWKATFEEEKGLPWSAWGPGIPLGPMSNADDVEKAFRAFLARNPDLAGVSDGELVKGAIGHVDRTDTWYVRLDQVHEGLPIFEASVDARIQGGRLVQLGLSTWPIAESLARGQVSAAEAESSAIRNGPAPFATHHPLGTRAVVVPISENGVAVFHRCWEVRTETWKPRGRWVTWVDQTSGQLLGVRNDVLYGTVSGYHDTRTVDGDMSTSRMPFISVSNGSSTTNADANGEFTLDGDDFTSTLNGTEARSRNMAGSAGSLSFTGDEGLWDSSSATQAEIDAYVFVHDKMDWLNVFAPEVAASMGRVTVNVNWGDYCNAYYDGDINTFSEGYGCNNTGRIADVIYHEWGHGFHYYSLISGYFDETVSEAIADVSSVLQTGDPRIGPYFYTDGSAIRDISWGAVYPDDWVGESHYDSLIISGAVWDLLGILESEYGTDSAWDIVSRIVTEGIKSGPSTLEVYDAFLAGDDDDADLSDGTPHGCEILEAFVAHGLGPGGVSDLVSLVHNPILDQPSGAPGYDVSVSVENIVPSCVSIGVDGGSVWFSFDGGATWDSVGLTASSSDLTGTIPPAPDGTIVEYYVEVEAADGTTYDVPESGWINPNYFLVGDAPELYLADFEADDGGYTHELLEGAAEDGADDWQWGIPRGAAEDPSSAWSGRHAWANDLGNTNYNGQYQNDIKNRLNSPVLSVAPYIDIGLEFYRVLNVEDGIYDHANVLANDQLLWTNYATSVAIGDQHSLDNQWARTILPFEDADLDGNVTLAWELDSDPGLTFGGWTLDDVRLVALPTARNLLMIRDFLASDDQPTIDFTWTNPTVANLASIRIVKLPKSFPTHADEGEVVFEDDAPSPSAPATASIDTDSLEPAWYAIFASDADGTWSVGGFVGFNADTGQAVERSDHDTGLPNDDTGSPTVKMRNCGCTSETASGGSWTFALALLGLLAGARRRPAFCRIQER
jgi:MYXO-CTERM domain-containing protein